MFWVWRSRNFRRAFLFLGVFFVAVCAGSALAKAQAGGVPPAVSGAQSGASGLRSTVPPGAGAGARDNFGASTAADSHSPEELEFIRSYEFNLPQNATLGAPISQTGSENYSTPLPKITPPAGKQPTALRLFRLIPPTIFENTVEGLDENGKQELADNGKSGPWVLTRLADDDLKITSSVPHSNTMCGYIYTMR